MSLLMSYVFLVIGLVMLSNLEYQAAYGLLIAAVYFRIPAEPVLTKEVK